MKKILCFAYKIMIDLKHFMILHFLHILPFIYFKYFIYSNVLSKQNLPSVF